MTYRTNKLNKDKKKIEKMIEREVVVPELESIEVLPLPEVPIFCKNITSIDKPNSYIIKNQNLIFYLKDYSLSSLDNELSPISHQRYF